MVGSGENGNAATNQCTAAISCKKLVKLAKKMELQEWHGCYWWRVGAEKLGRKEAETAM